MPIEITMPALSPTMEEGNLAKWLVKEGDSVAPGDVIAEIETDKATMEVEAVDEGVIAKILIDGGTEGVKVNQVIAVLAEEGEDIDAAAVVKTPNAPIAAVALATPPGVENQTREAATKNGMSEAYKNTAMASATNGTQRVFASPLARRIAEQNGIDLSAIKGSGPNGRVVKADVESVEPGTSATVESSSTASVQSVTRQTVEGGPSDEAVLALYKAEEYEVLPHDNMRKTIAARLGESNQTVPSYNLNVDCRIDALLALRKQINAAAPHNEEEKPSYRVSVNDFIIKAMALALQAVPMANASWTSGARILHKHSDVGVAVAIPDGLITPIVRHAEIKSLSQISNEIKDMAGRAKDRKLQPDEYQGGSTAVSNLGMFGVSSFTSIINPPQASIVSIGAGEQKPVIEDGEFVVGTMMAATFAFDHRVIDGALGAKLAGAFRNYIEKPMSMLV